MAATGTSESSAGPAGSLEASRVATVACRHTGPVSAAKRAGPLGSARRMGPGNGGGDSLTDRNTAWPVRLNVALAPSQYGRHLSPRHC